MNDGIYYSLCQPKYVRKHAWVRLDVNGLRLKQSARYAEIYTFFCMVKTGVNNKLGTPSELRLQSVVYYLSDVLVS